MSDPLIPRPLHRADGRAFQWARSEGLTDYADALTAMETRAAGIHDADADELIWFLEHPPLYTAGVSAQPGDLHAPTRFPVHTVGRGGQYTYHGPGQRVVYVMMDLRSRRRDVRAFVQALEGVVIAALADLGVAAGLGEGRIGVWVPRAHDREDKIAAIGVKVRRWVTFHGLALNVAPDLSHFAGITPCGISDARYGVTSLEALGAPRDMARVDAALLCACEQAFGPSVRASMPPASPPSQV